MKVILVFSFCCLIQQQGISQDHLLARSTTTSSGASQSVMISNKPYIIQQSVGQQGVIGTTSYSRQGFIQPIIIPKTIDEDNISELGIKVYPNPFQTYVNLSFKQDIESLVVVEVYDLLGRAVHRKKYSGNRLIQVDLSSLQLGEYIIKVSANEKQFQTKLLKSQ